MADETCVGLYVEYVDIPRGLVDMELGLGDEDGEAELGLVYRARKVSILSS